MDYKVKFKIFENAEQEEEARLGLEEHNRENPQYPPLPFVTENELRLIADDRIILDAMLWQDYGVSSDRVVSVEVIRDDSQELVRDTDLIALADNQPTCAHYDWTTEEVLAFARDAIALQMQRLKDQGNG